MRLLHLVAGALLALAASAQAQVAVSQLPELSAAPASNDLLMIVDVSDTSTSANGKTKKITSANLFAFRFPPSSTDEACARFDGTGAALQNSSSCTISDSGVITATGFVGPLTGNVTGNVSGNAGTVTTNANLTGHVTSIGNAAVLGSFTVSQLNTALSDGDVATGGGTATGNNTGDQTNITGNAGTATALAANPADCSSGQYANAIAANGDLTCAQVTSTQVSGLGTLATQDGTFSGTSSGTNTGDQTSIVGITGSLAEFNTALTGADFATGGGTATGTNTGDQTTITGNAGTATALATNGTNCSAGQAPRGVDAGGNAEDCTGYASTSSANTFTAAQTAQITDSGTNTVVYPAIVDHQSSGTPANGIGVGRAFDVETSAGNTERGATIEAVVTDATSTSEDFVLVNKLMLNGAAASEVNRLTWKSSSIAGWTFPGSNEAYSQAAGWHFYNTSGNRMASVSSGFGGYDGYYLASGNHFGWSSSATDSRIGLSGDTSLARLSAGVIRATDGQTAIRGLLGGGAAVASASALPVPTGRVFHVTGTTNITSITSTNFASGACITMIFDGALTLTDGNNIKAAGNFVTAADSTWSACYDGSNWHETARSTN